MMKTVVLAFIMLVVVLLGPVFAQDLNLLGAYDLNRPAFEVVVEGNYAYIPDEDSGLVVLDVSDPTNPFLVAQGAPETRADRLTLFGNFIYASKDLHTGGAGSTEFKTINVSDPAFPVLAAQIIVTGSLIDIDVSGDYAFVLNSYGNNLSSIDISNPYNPQLVNSFHVTGLLGRIQIIGDIAYIITFTGHGLRIINIEDPLNPFEIGHSPTPGTSYDLYVRGDYAYICDISDLTIIDISEPSSPAVLQDTFQVYTSGCVTANDDYSFVGITSGFDDEYFAAINVQNPENPFIVGSYAMPDPSFMGKPVIANDCVYLPQYGGNYQLMIFNAAITAIEENYSKPDRIGLLNSYPNPFNDQCIISFVIPDEAHVKIDVFDILGRMIATPLDETRQAGANSVIFDGSNFASGTYFYRISMDNYSKANSMVLLK